MDSWGDLGGGDPSFGGDGGPGADVGADPGGGSGDSGMVTDPTTGDVYDSGGKFIGNINDPSFGGGAGGTPSLPGGLDKFMKSIGATSKDGSLNWPMLLSMLGIGVGGLTAYNSTKKATNDITGGLANANKAVTDILSGASGAYKPYQDAGAAAVARLSSAAPSALAAQFQSNLGGQFGPLGNGRGIGGPVTFKSLMGK